MATITTLAQLESLYGPVGEASLIKEIDHVNADYRAMIEASPFAILASSGPEGLDCSPRGDVAGFVRVSEDGKTLFLPDRRGNNRVDSLRNIVRDPRIAMLFLIPGLGHTLRVNGRGQLRADPDLLKSFVMDNKEPRCVIAIEVQTVYFQCARAIVRSELWNSAKHVDPASVPTAGKILARLSENQIGGKDYDCAWPARAKSSLW